jgi:hypothetical protein
MELLEELDRVARLAAQHVDGADVVSGIVASEPRAGERVYLVSVDGGDGLRSWIGIRADGEPVTSRRELREAVSIAALCEVAADAAGGGDLDALVASLAEVRRTEAPPGIEHAEEAAQALRAVLADAPRVATPERLDEIGAATRRLERELDPAAPSPFSSAMQAAQAAVGELQREIEAGYRLPLE